jgi:hypothetical protein
MRFHPFSERLRRHVEAGARMWRSKSVPRKLIVEYLEDRSLPSVQFTPAAYATPPHLSQVPLSSIGNAAPVEPALSVNPADPTQLAVSSQEGIRVSTNAGGGFTGTSYYPTAGSGDTTTAYDSAGRLFWVSLSSVGISITQVNPTTGAIVPNTTFTVDNHGSHDDKPFMCIDTSPTSPYRDSIYVVWTWFGGVSGTQVWVAHSRDQGHTWSPPFQVSTTDPNEGFVWPATVATAPNGNVAITYHSVSAQGFARYFVNPDGIWGQTFFVLSADGGNTFPLKTVPFNHGQSDVTFNIQAYANGQTAGNRLLEAVFDTQGSNQPWVLPDPIHPGYYYVVSATDVSNGADPYSRIVFSRSTNNGATWSFPQTNGIIAPFAGDRFQLFPTAAIDRFGDIVVAWYDDRRSLTNSVGHYLLDVYATYSTDGGLTWAPAFMVNDAAKPFDPDPGAITEDDRLPHPPSTYRIGEYFGIGLYGGTAYVAWNGNTFNGSTPVGQQVWFDPFSIRGSLTVTATANDTITVRNLAGNDNFVEVLENGQRQYVGLWSGLTSITINATAANDAVTIRNTAASVPVIINLGNGNTATVGAPTLNNAGSVSVNGPVGNPATLIVDDQGTPTTETYTVTDSSISRTGGGVGPINYSNIRTLKLYVGMATESVNVPSTAAGTTTSIFGGHSTDTITIGAPGLFNRGPIAVDGQTGFCILNVNDQPDVLAQTYTITSTTVTRTGSADANTITYGHIGNLVLRVGSGAETVNVSSTGAGTTAIVCGAGTDTVNVTSTATGTATTIDCGNGTDTVNLSPSAHNLDGIQGFLTVNGGTGNDTLNVFDQAKQFTSYQGNYAVSSTSVSRGAAAISYSRLAQLNVYTGEAYPPFVAPVLVNVTGTALGTATNITAETGVAPTYFTVGDSAHSLSAIQGRLSLGGTSQCQLSVNDQAATTGQSYSVNGNSIDRSGSAGITFPGIYPQYGVSLRGGSGANTFTVANTPAAGITLNTGAGTDAVSVQATTGGLAINVQGGGGNDVVNLGLNNSLASINGAVTIANAGGPAHLNVNDSADQANRAVMITSGGIAAGLAPAAINFTSSSVNTLVINGGSGNNAYTVAVTPAATGVTVNPGSGVDTVSVQRTTALVTINSAGGSGADSVIVGDSSNTLDFITGDVHVNAAATDTLVLNDQGTSRARTYAVYPDFVIWSGHAVMFSGLGAATVNGSANSTFDLSAGTSPSATMILNGAGSSSLVGSNAGDSWEITGADSGTLSGSAYPNPVTFSNVGSLTAGGGGDYFLFDDGATLSGSVTDLSGTSTLDYTPYTTNVIVDLQTGVATGVGGSVSGILNVTGGSGAPGTSGLYNLLIGNGFNTLTGGSGRRNILVAGGGASTLNAGNGEDLLIGGFTMYDTDPALASWLQIAAYWAGTDDYFTRVGNLTSGNGVPLLDATNITGNGGGNTMNGNGALALIYSDGADAIGGFDPNSIVVPISP